MPWERQGHWRFDSECLAGGAHQGGQATAKRCLQKAGTNGRETMTGTGIHSRVASNRTALASAIASAIALAAAVPAFAQEDRADNSQDEQGTDIVVTGFKNEDTSGALKGNVPVRDIPLTISGYNEEFIR